ncbi:MAG TPA: tetratricopeptide repeat protein, partial [Myxococcota bacterium]|nr:tetratricopeptide repeat protein [Myxococcota bacterium]
MRRDSAPGDQERPGRLQREGQALARLSHPNVVPVFDVGAHEGQLFVAMEQVDGWTLERWLQAEPRTVGQILEVFEAAGQGLAAAHRAGLIHRDFKPANVMVGRDGRVRVTDFGLARLAEGPEPAGQAPRPPAEGALTQTGAQLGTPAFMAPEQIRGEPVSAATDQFAFCVALYQALFGAHPFLWEPGQGTQALWQAVVEGRLREVPRRRSLPGRARVALQRGLSPDPGARNPGMEALLAAVRPAPRLRRLVLAASLAAAGLAAAAGLGLRAWVTSQERAAAELCERAAGKIEQSLGPERRSALAALLAKASPGAERRAAAALEGLERWAGRWEDGYRDACLASSVRHEQSPEVMLLRTQCLDTRLREFDQVVLAFLEGDPALLGQAPQVVARLTGLDSCGDTVALRAPLQPAAELAPAVARARERLADVLAMYKTARVDQALPLARETLEQARGLGFRPLQAEAGQALAKLLFAKADYAAQEATLRRALADALAGRHDALAVEILADLGYLLGPARNEYQQAQDVFELAQALLDRLGGVGYLQMFVDNNQAASFMAQGKHAEAEAVLTRLRAAKLRAEQGQAVHSLHLGRIDTNLGAALVGQRKFEAALPLYQEARTVMEQNLGPDHPDLAVVQNNLIEPLFELGRKDEARRVAEEVLAARIRALGADHPQTNTTRFNLASLLIDAGQYPQARAVLEESLVHYRTRFGPDHVAAADALSALGSVLLAQGEP